jgi:hypothetical protein
LSPLVPLISRSHNQLTKQDRIEKSLKTVQTDNDVAKADDVEVDVKPLTVEEELEHYKKLTRRLQGIIG